MLAHNQDPIIKAILTLILNIFVNFKKINGPTDEQSSIMVILSQITKTNGQNSSKSNEARLNRLGILSQEFTHLFTEKHQNTPKRGVDSVVSFESFRALKLSILESFRALKLSFV